MSVTHDALLLMLADAVDDLERTRIATENRLRSLEQSKGMPDCPEAETMKHVASGLLVMEKAAIADLRRAMRKHPLGGWVKQTVGLGEKQAARLLAALGDPADRAKPSQLRQFAGHGDPERSRRRKGERCGYSPTAKMRTHLCAKSALISGVRKLDGCDDSNGYDLAHREAISPLGAVYLEARAGWIDREVSEAHQHNHALRLVGKEILLDLWREARRVRDLSILPDPATAIAMPIDGPPGRAGLLEVA